MKGWQMLLSHVLLVVATPVKPADSWPDQFNAFCHWLGLISENQTALILPLDDAQPKASKLLVGEQIAGINSGQFDSIMFYGARSIGHFFAVPKGAHKQQLSDDIREFSGPWFMALIEALAHEHQVPIIDLSPVTAPL